MPAREGYGFAQAGRDQELVSRGGASNLADILERVLDKGIVVAGDIVISLVDVELLTIRLRLLVASVDKAREMGINWWEHDPWLTSGNGRHPHEMSDGPGDQPALGARLERLEDAVDRLTGALASAEKRSKDS